MMDKECHAGGSLFINDSPFLQESCTFGHDGVTHGQSLLDDVFLPVIHRKDGDLRRVALPSTTR